MRNNVVLTAMLITGFAFQLTGCSGVPDVVPANSMPPDSSGPQWLNTPPPEAVPPPVPVLSDSADPTKLKPVNPEDADRKMPINLATALRLADARPLVIEAARAAVETEVGLYEQARVLWLPNVYLGADYQTHAGGQINTLTAGSIVNTNSQFLAGAGATAVFALTDAIYAPLAARQLLQARNTSIQTAKNDALLQVAQAYFDVQQARGILAGTEDSLVKGRDLARRIGELGKGLAPGIEVRRVEATIAELQQAAATARQDWRTSSATLARLLRLDPSIVVVPLEPPHLQISLISPKENLDDLIRVGLTNRPELASQQAVVQAVLTQLQQERMRPLIPSVILQSNSAPNQLLGVGIYGVGPGGLNSWSGRSDWNAQVVWEFRNLGFGNQGLVAQRRGEQRQAMVELFRIQDQVAAEVVQAHAQVEAAGIRVKRAEAGLKAALASYDGNLIGLSETLRGGDLLVLVNRPQEVEAALEQLQLAYVNYYTSANDYDRAEFTLFRAMGFQAGHLACGNSLGPVKPVDVNRLPEMAPVQAPEPCENCHR